MDTSLHDNEIILVFRSGVISPGYSLLLSLRLQVLIEPRSALDERLTRADTGWLTSAQYFVIVTVTLSPSKLNDYNDYSKFQWFIVLFIEQQYCFFPSINICTYHWTNRIWNKSNMEKQYITVTYKKTVRINRNNTLKKLLCFTCPK